MKEKFYTCRYDKPFKEIMLKESNKDILKALLENILHVDITNIEINNIERNSGNLNIKRKYLDALLTTNEGMIELEVNSCDKPYVHPRNMSYICDIYAHHTLVRREYNEDTKIIQINLNYGIKDNKNIRVYKVIDEDGKLYVKNFYIYDVNMEYYKKIWYDKNEEEIEKNKYLIMMDLEKEELIKISKDDKVVYKYMEDLENLNKMSEFREYMTYEMDKEIIHNTEIHEATKKGKKEGLEEGKKESAIDIAKIMLKDDVDVNTISKYTGLTINEIESLNK